MGNEPIVSAEAWDNIRRRRWWHGRCRALKQSERTSPTPKELDERLDGQVVEKVASNGDCTRQLSAVGDFEAEALAEARCPRSETGFPPVADRYFARGGFWN